MSSHDKDKKSASSPAPARQRERLDERNEANTSQPKGDSRDPRNMTPEGRDPREPTSHAGSLAASENVTTDEQKAAQEARKGDLGGAGTSGSIEEQRSQAAQIESQVASAENPLSPVSTVIPPQTMMGDTGLTAPPVPPNSTPAIPQPVTPPGQAPTQDQRNEQQQQTRKRRKLEEDTTDVKLRSDVTLTDDQGRQHQYKAGKVSMPKAHAEHWYIQQFLADDED